MHAGTSFDLMCYGLVAAVFAYLGTLAVRRVAIRSGMLDVPNERSSHDKVVPRGGGLSIVFTVLVSTAFLGLNGQLPAWSMAALLGGGGSVALVGYLDDRRGMPASTRIAVHLLAAVAAILAFGGLPPQPMGYGVLDFGILAALLALLGIVWLLNLFNFMDGIDGIAAAQTVFVSLSGAWLAIGNGAPAWTVITLVVLGGAGLGFLSLNWAPARIFMGDAGSGFIGYMIAVVALATMNLSAMSVWTWLILACLFIADATVTLMRRMARGERFAVAHRTHAYQWMSRRWSSHAKVTLLYSAINVVVVLPLALLSVRWPDRSAGLALIALGTAGLFALLNGAGRAEKRR